MTDAVLIPAHVAVCPFCHGPVWLRGDFVYCGRHAQQWPRFWHGALGSDQRAIHRLYRDWQDSQRKVEVGYEDH